jgi:Surface-adhesin protein E
MVKVVNMEMKKRGDPMKSLSVRVGVPLLIIFFFVVGCQTPVKKDEYSKGASWKFYGSTEDFEGYYDTQNIIHPSKNIVRVRVRLNITEKGVLYFVRNLGNKYENVSYCINLNEINCLEKKYRSLSRDFYDNKGEVIISTRPPSKWNFITPESIGENLFKEVCK